MEKAASIPGYENYSVTRNGDVHHGERQLKPIQAAGKSARVKLRAGGKVTAIAVAKLVAMTHVPNPHNHTHIILIDRDKDNCHADNIVWVSLSDSIRYNQRHIEIESLSQQPSTLEDSADRAAAMPIPGYENYAVTPCGKVYHGQHRLYASQGAGNRAERVKLRDAQGKSIRITTAKLVAMTFIPNPDNYDRLIFIDRDSANCCVENLRWVSAVGFIRFVKRCAETDELLGIARPKREPDWIDP